MPSLSFGFGKRPDFVKGNAMRLQVATLAMLAALAPPSHAEDIQPGLWELTLETRAAAAPDFSPAPYTLNQCLTAQDAQDPSRVLGGTANPGASDCTYTGKKFSGNVFRFQMQCAGSLGLQAQGEVVYSASSMEGSINSTMSVAGQTSELQSRIVAHRMGGC